MKHNRAAYQAALAAPAPLLPPAEPVFLLRGQDLCAPATVRFWAQEAQKRGVDEHALKAALKVAADMEAWSIKQTAGNALKGLWGNPKNSSQCCSKPSGRMAPTVTKSSD